MTVVKIGFSEDQGVNGEGGNKINIRGMIRTWIQF
jgi:hypothetical protein